MNYWMIMKENILPAVVSTKRAAISLLLTTVFLFVFWPVDSFASQWSEPVRIFSPSWGGESAITGGLQSTLTEP